MQRRRALGWDQHGVKRASTERFSTVSSKRFSTEDQAFGRAREILVLIPAKWL